MKIIWEQVAEAVRGPQRRQDQVPSQPDPTFLPWSEPLVVMATDTYTGSF